jgi:HK97 gp10 family phage protein
MTTFDGFDDLADALREIEEAVEDAQQLIDPALDSAVEDTAKAIERSAKKNLKRHGAIDTGNLRGSIGYGRVDVAHFRVGTPVEYAPHVEYGTAAHVIEADNADYLRFPGKGGNPVYRKSVQHPGTPAQPYLRPALQDHQSTLAENIEDEIERVFETVFG